MFKSVSLIIILLLILAIMVFAVFLVKRIQQKLRYYSKAIWGTNTVKEGIDKMQAEYAGTPKSVSAMTSLCLPRITADFPDFNYEEMRERANNVLTSYLMAIDRKNAGLLNDGNRELQEQLATHIAMLDSKELTEHFERMKIHRTEISQYRKEKGRCTITFQSSIQYYHYVTNKAGQVLEGKHDMYFQSKYDVDLIYIQDRNLVENELDLALGINCPNCGAPISNLGAKHCEYCGTPVIELNIHAWSFSDIRELRN